MSSSSARKKSILRSIRRKRNYHWRCINAAAASLGEVESAFIWSTTQISTLGGVAVGLRSEVGGGGVCFHRSLWYSLLWRLSAQRRRRYLLSDSTDGAGAAGGREATALGPGDGWGWGTTHSVESVLATALHGKANWLQWIWRIPTPSAKE